MSEFSNKKPKRVRDKKKKPLTDAERLAHIDVLLNQLDEAYDKENWREVNRIAFKVAGNAAQFYQR